MSVKVGDIVRLKSGSPSLTVAQVDTVKDIMLIRVEWFNDGELHRDAFDARSLYCLQNVL